ncbi:GDSL-type esterase/lipase family protein [Flavobacterium sp.]|uniref:GDSL-type esterase/lipase family protein n=1 Tax=Flavobacterium sp. TaxID=239 RepID=UPI00286C9F68|nr:GDSL-type esterase/lipase family protein [Flavobacterium sp.]
MKKITFLHILSILFCTSLLFSQDASRFQNDIQTIKQYDKIYAPPKEPILFIGSSSFRLWNDLERTFADYAVLNRGIGGAVIKDITYYIDDLITPYKPRQIFIYVGENDIANEATSETVLKDTKHLLTLIRERLPNAPIVYISIKPSPSREKYLTKVIEANKLIRDYIATQKNIHFIDVYSLMLTPEGKSKPELFREDNIHMNNLGYDIWIKEIKPYLLKR